MPGGLFDDGSNPSIIDCAAFLDSDIPKHFAELISMGVLVSVGTTRDRGAVSITITSDGKWDRQYFRDSSDATDYLRRATDLLRGMGLSTSAPEPPAIQKPVRGRRIRP